MKRPSIPFAQVVEKVDLLDACEFLGVKLKKEGNAYRTYCPECDNTRMAITPGEGFICHQCELSGDVIALVKAYEGHKGMYDAAARLVDVFNLEFKKRTVPKKKVDKETKKLSPLLHLIHDHEVVNAFGLEPDEAEKLGIGWSTKGLTKNSVAVPLRLEDGTLVGYLSVSRASLAAPLQNAGNEGDAAGNETVVKFPSKSA